MSDLDRTLERSIPAVLASGARLAPDAPAIGAPGRVTLTHGALWTHVQETVVALNAIGIGRSDRVAIVLPNGPEMAVAFLTVACAATSAPLNPACREEDFEFYLSDLQARALLLLAEAQSPARAVAARHAIPALELVPSSEGAAGHFALRGPGLAARTGQHGSQSVCDAAVDGGLATAEDVALVLHTSGTTSRPKAVPLTHSNLCASAHHIRHALQLTPSDQCLNVLPLFHIHGLVAALLASLATGASVGCSPGFAADAFFDWMDECHPTWYTAVPTMHQAILRQALAHPELIARTHLRFVRSSSAPLPRKAMADLENTFGAPVIEACGMTEAAHQMASNPLPPGQRKAGSVGPAAGPEVAIMDNAGNLLARGAMGEVAIRGPNVMGGYLNNPEANAKAFANGWLRTGDQGYLASDGYLFLTGRLKEIINRGGEKVNPVEVDGVLLEHPSDVQAATLPVPHPTLGEDVLTAVVLQEGTSATDHELRDYAFSRLAAFKVPSRILIVPEIRKGATGKLQRLGLAQRWTDRMHPAFVAPRTVAEQALTRMWTEVLGVDKIGVHVSFFDLGGHSLQAMRIIALVRQEVGVELSLRTLFRYPTVAGRAAAIADAPTAQRPAMGPIPRLRRPTDGPPVPADR
jgi:acyl-CoA synthetase (AMP-forming)/AMP-acid ligase II/acyl carrier protein